MAPSSKPTFVDISPQATQVLLSLATGPLLLGIVGAKAAASLIQDLGQWSEEIFRGDRLPIIDSTASPTAASESSPEN